MSPSNTNRKKTTILSTLISGLALWGANAAVVTVNYPETAPSTDLVSSYVVASAGNFGVYNFSSTSYREISTSFITPSSSDFLVNALTMQIASNTTTNFTAPANFSIEVWSLTGPANGPASSGSSLLTTYTGVMQPTAAQVQVGDYFTFAFATPFTATAGASYSFIMSIDDPAAGNILRWSIGAPDPAGTRALSSTNGAAWANSSQTFINYVQGTAVPEPGAMVLLGLAGVVVVLARKRSASARNAA